MNPHTATLDQLSCMVDVLQAHGADVTQWRIDLAFLETQQEEKELASLVEVARGKHSFLEIGSRFGGTLWRVAQVLAPGSLVVSVDYPAGDLTPCPHYPKETLERYAEKIRGLGHRCVILNANSQHADTVETVRSLGPFDMCFIDADHSYEGVKQDWENYGPMCKVVAFHDIAGLEDGCVRLWNDIKGEYSHSEFVVERNHMLGIGVLYK